jgi:hypothetical protein
VIFDAEQAELVERLRRELEAMDAWSPRKQLDYQIRLGVRDRKARYTRNFGGEASPEPESLPTLEIPATEAKPLVRLLYMLRYTEEIVLDGPTARSITGEGRLVGLVNVINEAVRAGLAQRISDRPLTETERDLIYGVKLTEEGRRLLERVLHLGETRTAPAP